LVTRPIDDRLLRKYYIEGLTAAPDIVVLGSSHSAWVGGNIFPGSRIVNSSVPGAVLADYLGIFENYAKRGLYPQRVILLLDPQLIAYPVISDNWVSINEDTLRMLGRLGIHSDRFKQPLVPLVWGNLFSFSYFQQSILKLQNAQGETVQSRILFKDGRWFKVPFKGAAPGILHQKGFTPLLGQVKMDGELEAVLEKFIRYLMAEHIKVTLWMLPFRPGVYDEFAGQGKPQAKFNFVSVEGYYRGLAGRLGLGITGSLDPVACGLNNNDFVDGEHIKYNVLERMLKQQGTKCSMPGL